VVVTKVINASKVVRTFVINHWYLKSPQLEIQHGMIPFIPSSLTLLTPYAPMFPSLISPVLLSFHFICLSHHHYSPLVFLSFIPFLQSSPSFFTHRKSHVTSMAYNYKSVSTTVFLCIINVMSNMGIFFSCNESTILLLFLIQALLITFHSHINIHPPIWHSRYLLIFAKRA
jgi:hypothetical protein